MIGQEGMIEWEGLIRWQVCLYSVWGITLIYGAELIVKICSHVNGFSHGAKLYVKTHSHTVRHIIW